MPKGATTEAGAKAYEMKFPHSPMFMRRNPNHLGLRDDEVQCQ